MTLGVFALHLWLSHRISGPSVILDEAGYLGNARWLAGESPTYGMPLSPPYGFGYSLLLAPLHWVFSDPGLLWRSILVLNAVLLSSLVPLLASFGRRLLGLDRAAALAAATVGALVPAATGASVSALSENLGIPLLVVIALALLRALEPGPLVMRVWFGPAVALLYASHSRYTLVLAAAAIVLVGIAWRVHRVRVVAAVNLVALTLLVAATRVIQSRLLSTRWSEVDYLEGSTAFMRRLLTSRTGLADVTSSAFGQAWYLAAGSLGLTVLGIGLLGALAAGRSLPGPAPAGPDPSPGPLAHADVGPRPRWAARVTAGFLLAAALGTFAASVLFFTRTQFRADHLIYGRHNDTFSPIWVASGLGLLLRASTRRALLPWLAGAATALAVLSVGNILLQDPTTYGGTYAYFSVPAISRVLGDPASGTYVRATAMAAVGLLVIAVTAWLIRRPRLLMVPLALWFVWSGLGRVEDVDSFSGATYRDWNLPEQVRELGVTELDLEADAARGATVLSYQFWMPEVAFDLYEPKLGQRPDGPFVFAPLDDLGLADRGARIALIDDGGFYEFRGTPAGIALWVLPGPDQRRLARGGLLLPTGFPSELPPAAQRAELEILDRLGSVEVAPGEAVPLTIRGRHTGTGAPWPDEASYRGEWRVRILADIVPLDAGGARGAPSGGELPMWIDPGETFTQEVRVFALDQFFGDLDPGRYRVTLGLGQPDGDWFAGAGDATTFTMVVTEA